MPEGSRPSNARLDTISINGAARDGGRDWGGSFVAFQVTILTRHPSVFAIFVRGCDRGIRSSSCHARRRSTMSSDAVGNSCCPDASCTVVVFFLSRCSATRSRTSTALPGDDVPPSFHFSPGGAPGFNRPFAGLLPRMGGASISAARAHVSFRRPASRPD